MNFELLNPNDIRVGDLYLDVDKVNVYGILSDKTTLFSQKHLINPEHQAISLSAIVPNIISYVDKKGFRCKDAKGEVALYQDFDKFMGGIIITQREKESKLYVSQMFLDMLSQYVKN